MEKVIQKVTKGFTFGKFLPFHKGHEAMIRFAKTKCDVLSVLICCSDKESIASQQRSKWLKDTFKDDVSIEILVVDYTEKDFPNTSESSEEVSAIWSNYFLKLFPDYDFVTTSEPYGEFVAQHMQIKHISFDQARTIIPTSATAIRSNLKTYWHFLPESVQKDLATKIVVVGTECSGKTTLVNAISQYCDIEISPEAGREIIQNSNAFDLQLLHLVANTHAQYIQQAITQSPVVIIDTDIHITQSYAKKYFGDYLNISDSIYETNKADLYLYLTNDLPYEQDGTRLSKADRNEMDKHHRLTLQEFGVQFVEIGGDWENRFQTALKYINQTVKQKQSLLDKIN